MENISNYIIFHPNRDKVKALATVINSNNEIIYDWEGQIFVDNLDGKNEDPFIFNNPWIYSYCHASQLKRNQRRGSYLQPGSKLIFVSGPDADNGMFTVDTIFIIDSVLKWDTSLPANSREVPSKYSLIKNDRNSVLWNKHFKFPFEGQHSKVTHSYEAKLWEDHEIQTQYSYLPLTENQQSVSIPFSELPCSIMNILIKKRKGKFPAEISSEDINLILELIESKTSTKVVRDIRCIELLEKGRKKSCGGC